MSQASDNSSGKNNDIDIGPFFTPEGNFNVEKYRFKLIDVLKSFNKNGDIVEIAATREWLSHHLKNAYLYCSEHDCEQTIIDVYKTALETAADEGIDEVSLPLENLRNIFHNAKSVTHGKDDKAEYYLARKQRIFGAALIIFAKKGYQSATMDEIAALSNVGKGSIYRYFKNKEELLAELLEEHYGNIIKRIKDIFSGEHDLQHELREMIEVWIEFIENNPVVYRLIQVEAISQKLGDKNMFYDYFVSSLPNIKEQIVELSAQKKIKTKNFYTVFYGILGFIDGVTHRWFMKGMSYSLKDEIPLILEVLFNGFFGEEHTGEIFFN